MLTANNHEAGIGSPSACAAFTGHLFLSGYRYFHSMLHFRFNKRFQQVNILKHFHEEFLNLKSELLFYDEIANLSVKC